MYTSSNILFIVILLSLNKLIHAKCCFDTRKVCESVSDVGEFGTDEWISMVIVPAKCGNVVLPTTPKNETITRDTFAKVPNLANIYIVDTRTRFGENPFEPLRNKLVYLSIIRNNISVIPTGVFVDLPKLKKLVLRDSGIASITKGALQQLPKLEVLLLSGNELTEVQTDILNDVPAKTLDLSFNIISTIEKNAFPRHLILLNLKKNELREIKDNTFSNLHSLEMLILSKNKVKEVRKGTFAGLSNLSKLDLSRNEIDTIDADTFSDLHELMFLYLKYNRLRVLQPDIFARDMINLTDLELERNNLTFLSEEIFKRMPNLEEISLGGNPWQCACLQNVIAIISNTTISISDDRMPNCNKLKSNQCIESLN